MEMEMEMEMETESLLKQSNSSLMKLKQRAHWTVVKQSTVLATSTLLVAKIYQPPKWNCSACFQKTTIKD